MKANTLRDNQRSKIYKAERVAFDGKFGMERFADLREIEQYLHTIWKRKRLRNKYRTAFVIWNDPPKLKDGRGRTSAAGNARAMWFPRWSRKKWVIIHELAHVVQHRQYRSTAGHGWEFASIYLTLVRELMGKDAHDALKKSFKEHRVKFKAPIVRKPMSAERRAELTARLAEARKKKLTAKTEAAKDTHPPS